MSRSGHAKALTFTVHADGRSFEETFLISTAVQTSEALM